jgi:GH24 family phage-related lysozyme (muramidase)
VDDRAQRILDNERSFRTINRRLREDLERGGEDGAVAFVCECGHMACHASIELTSAQYAEIHRRGDQFVALPDHVLPEVEDVVDRGTAYVVVRKREP